MKLFETTDNVIKCNAEDFIESLKGETLIVYSPSAIKLFEFRQQYDMISIYDISKNTEKISQCFEKCKKYDNIVAIGGGSVIDVAKYIAFNLNKNFVVVPTMLSTNAISTDKACLLKGDIKITFNVKKADYVIFDEQKLQQAGIFNVVGLFDVFSIYTASKDWELSVKYNNEEFNECYDIAKELLDYSIDFANTNDVQSIQNKLSEVYKQVSFSGIITNIYGTGRPESGSEHIFAKELEYLFETLPHGIAVANGIVLMSILQGNGLGCLHQIFKKFDLVALNQRFGVNSIKIRQALETLAPRVDRYSIINHTDLSKRSLDNLLQKYEQVIAQLQ